MKNTKQAGTSGKGFYAALSLSVAMVGAACWYANSQAAKPTPSAVPEHSMTTVVRTPAQTAPAVTTAVTVTRPPAVTVPTTAAPQEAEEAAAILRRTTALTEAPAPQPAETQAPVEQPLPPVEGEVLQGFSHGELVKSPTTGIWSTHNGIDFAAPYGTEVIASEDGTVTAIERDALFGICVTVLHDDGTVTRYCGLNEGLNVQAGELISRGTVIGAVGDTNEAESTLAPHLHFEVLHNDAYIDPQSYLAGALNAAQIPPQ